MVLELVALKLIIALVFKANGVRWVVYELLAILWFCIDSPLLNIE